MRTATLTPTGLIDLDQWLSAEVAPPAGGPVGNLWEYFSFPQWLGDTPCVGWSRHPRCPAVLGIVCPKKLTLVQLLNIPANSHINQNFVYNYLSLKPKATLHINAKYFWTAFTEFLGKQLTTYIKGRVDFAQFRTLLRAVCHFERAHHHGHDVHHLQPPL